MKTQFRSRSQQQGTVLMVTLFLAVLFGMFLFYYLNGVQTQKGLVARSQGWNSALSLAEAGVEEALAQMNPGAPAPTVNDFTVNGWGTPVGGLYGPVSRTLDSGSYAVAFTTNTFPIIYSTGYVSIPPFSAGVQRAVRVATTTSPLFAAGIAAKNGIDLKGNNINTDSFNSALASLSTNGVYDASKASTNGNIASIAGIVNVGNADVNGSVLLGPTATDSILANGSVTGGVNQDFNVEFEDVVLPKNVSSWVGASASPLTIAGITYNYTFLTTGDYTIANLNSSIYVGSNANVRIKLSGNATATLIEVAGQGATAGKLTVYMDGPTFKLSGNEVVDSRNAANFAYYGTTNNTSVDLGGNAAFTGTIYAPEANVSMGGGGNTIYDFVGAIVANTIGMNGHFHFHFDENLIAVGPTRFVASSWREL